MTPRQHPISIIRHNENYRTALLLFLFSFVLFYAFRIPVPINVDTALYARSIKTFEGPVVHLGYYGIGSLFQSFLGVFGLTPLQTLGVMSQFFGGIAVSGLYVFSLQITEDHLQSLLAALILMFSGAFWLYSIHGEVYVPQLAFVLLSLISIQKQRPLISSLCLLTAVSITPTSLLALVPIGYLMHMHRLGKKQEAFFLSPILIAFITIMLLEGPKIIQAFASAVYSPAIFLDGFSHIGLLREAVYRLIKAYGRSFNLISFFALIGFVVLYRKDRRKWGLTLSLILPFLAYLLNLALFSSDHLIISFIAVSLLGSWGILASLDKLGLFGVKRSVVIVLLLTLYSMISFEFLVSRQMTYSKEQSRVINALAVKFSKDGIMMADYIFGVSYASINMNRNEASIDLYEGRPNTYLQKNMEGPHNTCARLQKPFWVSFACVPSFASRKEFKSVVDNRPIYLVETLDWPVGLVQVFKERLIKMGLEKPRQRIRRVEDIAEYLEYKLGATITVDRIIASPLHPVYRLRIIGASKDRQND